LTDVPTAVVALEPGARLADEAVARGIAVVTPAITAVAVAVISVGIAADCRDISRPEAGIIAATVPPAVAPTGIAVPTAIPGVTARIGTPALIAPGVRISRSFVLAIGVRVEMARNSRDCRSPPAP